ncbi:hypothetical protein ACQJBY_012476 [Aegilops geniculata]
MRSGEAARKTVASMTHASLSASHTLSSVFLQILLSRHLQSRSNEDSLLCQFSMPFTHLQDINLTSYSLRSKIDDPTLYYFSKDGSSILEGVQYKAYFELLMISSLSDVFVVTLI